MKKQKTKAQLSKMQRRKKQRKNFELKRNVNKHKLSEVVEIKRDIFGPARDEKGEALMDRNGDEIITKVGTRTILKRRKVDSGLRMELPKSRKFARKKQVA